MEYFSKVTWPFFRSRCTGLGMNHYLKERFEMYSEADNVLSFIKITYTKGQSNIISIILGRGVGEGGEKVVFKSFKLPLQFPLVTILFLSKLTARPALKGFCKHLTFYNFPFLWKKTLVIFPDSSGNILGIYVSLGGNGFLHKIVF